MAEFPTIEVIRKVLDAPAYRYEGVRKIVTNIQHTFTTLPRVKYEDLGYTQAKFKQLQRNYWDEEEAKAFRALREKREKHGFSVLAIHPHGQAKREDSMGFCIDTLVLATDGERQDVTMFYRSTEVTRKFAGDLCFLPWVFDQLEIQPTTVTFNFAAAYFSGVFMGTLFRYADPIEFLAYLRENDPQMFKGGMRFLYRSVQRRDRVFPYSPENREHQLMWQVLTPKTIATIKAYLEKHLSLEYQKRHAHL